MAEWDTLKAKLDALEAQLPRMIEDNRDPADFWPAFAGEADVIEDQAGEHAALVSQRIDVMLAAHGRYLGALEMAVDDKQESGKAPMSAVEATAEPSANAGATGAWLQIDMPFRQAIEQGNYDWEALAAGVRAAQAQGCADAEDVAAVEGRTLAMDSMKRIRACLKAKAFEGKPSSTGAGKGGGM